MQFYAVVKYRIIAEIHIASHVINFSEEITLPNSLIFYVMMKMEKIDIAKLEAAASS
tara:strand:- start:180 stop:350 length:171 start_codon:yes stop_codon:yes gene_type:complete